MTATQTINELKEFVIDQAAEDSVLPSVEKRYQKELVSDVLSQEAPNQKALKMLLELYRTERQAA